MFKFFLRSLKKYVNMWKIEYKFFVKSEYGVLPFMNGGCKKKMRVRGNSLTGDVYHVFKFNRTHS